MGLVEGVTPVLMYDVEVAFDQPSAGSKVGAPTAAAVAPISDTREPASVS